MQGSKYWDRAGELHLFVPDENNKEGSAVTVASFFTIGQAFSANAAQNHTITNIASCDRCYKIRIELYNYNLAANDTARTV